MADLAMTGGGTGGMAPGMAGGHIGGGGSGQPSVSPSAPSSEYDQDEDVPKEYLCPLTLEVCWNMHYFLAVASGWPHFVHAMP